jgi:hypothetical protein
VITAPQKRPQSMLTMTVRTKIGRGLRGLRHLKRIPLSMKLESRWTRSGAVLMIVSRVCRPNPASRELRVRIAATLSTDQVQDAVELEAKRHVRGEIVIDR